MCSSWFEASDYDMPFELYRKIAIEVFPYTRALFFSCGHEPLMSSYLVEILEFTKQFNIPLTSVITNGTLLNEANIVKMVQVKLSTLFISIDGATKQTYETIRRGANFGSLISNIEMINKIKESLHSDKPNLIFTSVLMKSNLEESKQIVHLARSLNIKQVNFKPIKIEYEEMKKESLLDSRDLVVKSLEQAVEVGKEEIKVEIAPEMIEIAPEMSDYLNDQSSKGKDLRSEQMCKKCIEPFPSMYILPDGRVWPCTIWNGEPMGDFKGENFKDIWERDVYLEIRDRIASGSFSERCKKCYYMC
jgi:radical SAM protein with 4Fe4S-binding SPASM domain